MITITTDFGDSVYAGAVRGAILRRSPASRIVDVTHGVPAGDVVAGALALFAALPQFPSATPTSRVVHLAVVDPGVGTSRRGLAIQCRGSLLVGPDNGILCPAMRALGFVDARELSNADLWADAVSPVFHGRDVFGPVAAHLDAGGAFEDVGPSIEPASIVPLDFGEVEHADGAVAGKVLAVDPFGNVTTNIPEAAARRFRVAEATTVRFERTTVLIPFCRTYGEAQEGRPLALVGSSGFVEIAVARGSAAALFGLKPGDRVRLG